MHGPMNIKPWVMWDVKPSRRCQHVFWHMTPYSLLDGYHCFAKPVVQSPDNTGQKTAQNQQPV